MSNLRICIIGAGVMGRGHSEFLRDEIDGVEIVGISDVDFERAQLLSADLSKKNQIPVFVNPEQMFKEVHPDAVIIASPDLLHAAHVVLAIKHGLDILCEKPIAVSLGEADEVAESIMEYEASSGRARVHYGFMRRFDPSYIELRSKIESGEYGLPLFARTTTRNVTSPGITTDGLFTNIAVHDFDIWRWLTGQEWISVCRHQPKPSSLSPQGLADPLIFVAEMSSSFMIIADVVANNNYGYDLRTEVLCERGSIEIGTFGDVFTRAQHFAQEVIHGEMVENWIPRFKDAYIAELRAWVESVKTGTAHPDLATAADALAATKACYLAINS